MIEGVEMILNLRHLCNVQWGASRKVYRRVRRTTWERDGNSQQKRWFKLCKDLEHGKELRVHGRFEEESTV